ncbi:nitric oxide synthase-interacting protein homolog isoform X2 [Anopheles arabiensis]|uniref:Nitric oxide synthase-interacting protein homolog n=1 Tax=Anopheles merus TaxID=30066 RepID=A0A182VN77_ANOME|nr:nitric oxide synthase-interacting protein homolog isoform X2 [Anopheles arabiensis]XP_040227136.1 nitric oxide synthase-interacting protein homolog isoform X1 [Anopheles coluzzii]XP_041773621.1 nitric oxide synthase-interacting protein homolog isoform X1 [Anopheles merus]XP_041773622.1 nitric oxide synthase-interacting protein homolog isoform X1 [Anopheles merus]XP_061508172.1 nitric oxide synthase-interacting protein homolog isoform X1 [Anopheles gambiae]
MTRHARNCTAGAVYTYHEKKKDAANSGFGTTSRRIGKDSVKSFDCCSLTLQPCRNPVITKDGYLFDKEAILTYIISKKNEYSRKMKEYEKQMKQDEEEDAAKANAELQKKLDKFISTEKNIVSNKAVTLNAEQPSTSGAISNVSLGKRKELPSFWVPSQTPAAKVSRIEKPDSKIYCPVSNKPLKAKDLIEVKFTLVKDPADKKSLIAKENRYMCAVTHDILSNSVPCAVLKPTGDVVTIECIEKIIKKDMIHPLTNEKLSESDIIPLQRGGTGFATTNEKLEAKEQKPCLQV